MSKSSSTKKNSSPFMDQPKAPRVSPAQYVRNVKSEMAKVVWPTKKETIVTTIMVFIMVIFAATFFFLVDQALSYAIRLVLN